MTIKIVDEIDPDEGSSQFIHLSDIFKYISHYRRAGHQIGRKVGDMLEVLTLAAIYRNQDLRTRLVLEPKLEGFSGAGHKVEFAIYKLDDAGAKKQSIPNLLSFIECKKVGVEQTVNGTFKRNFSRKSNLIPYDQVLEINFKPRWTDRATRFEIRFKRHPIGASLSVTESGKVIDDTIFEPGHRLIFGLTTDGTSFFIDDSHSLRDIEASIRLCKILKISAVSPSGVTALLDDCLAGPQTPEKAKQASFVALDIRRGRFGQFDKRPIERECVSILVLTEFSHWEPKSVNMIKSALDHNLVVEDKLVIEAIEEYERIYGLDFLDRMTKEFFMSNQEARNIAARIVENRKGKIFRDISDGRLKEITFQNGAVIVRE